MVRNGDKKHLSGESREIADRKKSRAEEKERQAEDREAARLLRKLGSAYTEYNQFLAAHPQAQPPARGASAEDQAFYEQMRRNLGHANEAPRCTYVKVDGTRCGSPRMKTGSMCYAHQRMTEAHPGKVRLAPFDDANGIQLGLMQVCRGLIDGQITPLEAGKLLYALQTAASNVVRLTFHENPADIVVESPEPAPPERPLDMLPYEQIDEDLKLQLFAIGDEIDRRARERTARGPSTEARVPATLEADPALGLNSGPAIVSGGGANHAGEDAVYRLSQRDPPAHSHPDGGAER